MRLFRNCFIIFRFGCFTNDCSLKKTNKTRGKKEERRGKEGGKRLGKGREKRGKKGEEGMRAKQARCGKIGVLAGKLCIDLGPGWVIFATLAV